MGLQSQLGQGQLGLGHKLKSCLHNATSQLQMQQALGLGQLGLGEETISKWRKMLSKCCTEFLSPLLGNLVDSYRSFSSTRREKGVYGLQFR